MSLYIHTNLQGRFDRFSAIMEAINAFIDANVVGSTMHRRAASQTLSRLATFPLTCLML